MGIPEQPITFTAKDPGVPWQGIRFRNIPTGTTLDHCIVEHGNTSGLWIHDSSPVMRNCFIRNNSCSGKGGCVEVRLASGTETVELEGCFITDNSATVHGGGLRENMGDGLLRLISCVVARNPAGSPGTAGSYVGGGLYSTGNTEILNSIIAENACFALAENWGNSSLPRWRYLP